MQSLLTSVEFQEAQKVNAEGKDDDAEGGAIAMSKQEMKAVLEAGRMILSVCDGASKRDKIGYDLFDAGTLRFFFYPELFGVEGLTPEEVEFMRRKLLRYKVQLSKMRFNIDMLDEPVHDVSFLAYGEDWDGRCLRISPHSISRIPFLKCNSSSWQTTFVAYEKPSILKKVWLRFDDLDEYGKTRKWWELLEEKLRR